MRRRLLADLLVVIACLAVAALPACSCSGTPEALCSQNSDCGAGGTCISGSCARIPECSRSADCPSGNSCISGTCTPVGNSCTSNSNCAAGATCSSHKVCAPPSCTSAIDCGLQQVCIAGACAPVGTPPPNCEPGADACVFPPPVDSGTGTPPCVNFQCAQVSCADGGSTTLTGQVFDPSGQVPLYNALVYVPNGQVQPFDAGVTCDICGGGTSGDPLVIALTDATGSYTLQNVPAGVPFPLVMQIGKWRRQIQVPAINACNVTGMTDPNLQRFPRKKSEGDIPQFAIATGDADAFECLMLKMLDSSEFTRPDASGRVHMFVTPNGNPLQLSGGLPAASSLWGGAGTLAQYDVVLLPCEGGEYRKPDAGIQNLVDYTGVGGRLFVTHYSYVWTAFNAPFNTVAAWAPDKNQVHNPPDPFNTTIDTSFPKGVAFEDWLSNVGALTSGGFLAVHESRNDVGAVNSSGTRWVYGTVPLNTVNPIGTEHLTFNTPVNPPPLPDGDAGVQCGRVVFSDFHVTAAGRAHNTNTFPNDCTPGAMSAQEKALVFMLFDVSSCVQSDQVPPTICPALGQGCSTTQACCGGLSCLGQALAPCAQGESCTCQVPIN